MIKRFHKLSDFGNNSFFRHHSILSMARWLKSNGDDLLIPTNLSSIAIQGAYKLNSLGMSYIFTFPNLKVDQ